MNIKHLPIWPRILAAKPRKCSAKTPEGILRAVIAAGGLKQSGPLVKAWHPARLDGLQLVDRYDTGESGLPARRAVNQNSGCGGRLHLPQEERDKRRAAKDKRFARALKRKQEKAAHLRRLVLHIANRYHHTVDRLFVSRYADIRYQDHSYRVKDWPYKGSYKTYPREYSGGGAYAAPDCIRLHTYKGNVITLPSLPKGLIRSVALAEPHPIGLFAVPVKGQEGVFACMGTQKGKWVVVGFSCKGHHVPESFARGTLSLADIQQETNTEVQRLMIERFGHERYIRESGAQEIQHDDFGSLYSLPGGAKLVKVINSTINPDGTANEYWIPVPATVQTAHEAVAWSFGLRPDQYQPAAQS